MAKPFFSITPFTVGTFSATVNSDVTVALQAALNTYNRVIVTGGPYTISDTIIVPENRELIGGTFHIVGQPSGAINENHEDYWNAFEFQGGNVTVDGVTFIGENDPFDGQYVQNQCCALHFPHGQTYHNIRIQNCNFNNLFGFPLQGFIFAETCIIADNTATECGNGFNLVNGNGNGTHYLRNTLTDAEGIETAGSNDVIEDNILSGGLVGVSAGGNTTPGVKVVGQIVRNNTINGANLGIAIAEMASGIVVENNTITNVYNGILAQPFAQDTWIEDAVVRNNSIDGVTQPSPGVSGVGLYVAGDVRNTLFEDNEAINTVFGAQIRATTTTIRGGQLRGSTFDLFIQADIEDAVLDGVDYETCSGC